MTYDRKTEMNYNSFSNLDELKNAVTYDVQPASRCSDCEILPGTVKRTNPAQLKKYFWQEDIYMKIVIYKLYVITMVTVWRRKRQQGKYTNAWLAKGDHQHR